MPKPAAFRCPECRTRRKDYRLFTRHIQDTGHSLCNCGGYHFAHRMCSPYCYENPLSDLRHVARQTDCEDTLKRVSEYIIENHPGLKDKVRDLCKHLQIK